MMDTPIKKEIVDGLIGKLGIEDFAKATIREVKQVAAKSEEVPSAQTWRSCPTWTALRT